MPGIATSLLAMGSGGLVGLVLGLVGGGGSILAVPLLVYGVGMTSTHLAIGTRTLMMVAPMVVLMILAMAHMFKSKVANVTLLALSFAVFLGSFALIRTQTTIGDEAFLRSMIPHHSGAILMCQKAKLADPEIVKLCESIIRSQREEIDQMKTILARLDG